MTAEALRLDALGEVSGAVVTNVRGVEMLRRRALQTLHALDSWFCLFLTFDPSLLRPLNELDDGTRILSS